ncbi:facilitated trehalose transporter Tret1-like [Diorhabda sublineata]|uniref:facilitated trehalose transporter Tret1-like n=1 Tax=Diorhabda sublineata TaxID=1163346 RepID=UPI0024E0DC1C|nr:facilitated trehalose transporter Tret1-like [Diorhabda sublineata]
MDSKLVESGYSAIHHRLERVPWRMLFCSLSANLLVISLGLLISWYSPVIPKLMLNNTDVNPLDKPISALETSIITVIPSIGAIILFPFWAYIVDRIGRKTTMRMISSILICSVITTAFAKNINTYYISLPLTGISVNGGLLTASVYNTEISKDSNRGMFNCIMMMHIPIGIVLGYIFGSIMSVKCLSLLSTIPPILFLIASFFLPESPYYLLLKQNYLEGTKALEILRGTTNPREIETEIKKIKEIIASTTLSKSRTIRDIFSNFAIRKAFLISIQITSIEQLSGLSIILIYVSPIFNKAGSGLSGDSVGIIVGVLKLVTFSLATYHSDRLGRRKLILISTLCCAFPMFFLGFYFYLDHIGSQVLNNFKWISVILVVIYIISYSIGLGNVPLTFAGEVFPEDMRALGVSLVLIVNQSIMCIVIFAFPLVSFYYGPHWCFWICAMFCVIGFISMYLTVPETKGKSFLEIQHLFKKA